MKTLKFKILRFFTIIFIIATIFSNLVYFSFYIWKREVYDIERILQYGKLCSVRSFSLYIVYLNLITSFLFAYAFNLGSKALLNCCIWVSLFSICAGIFTLFYTKVYALLNIKTALGTTFFSNPTLPIKMMERYPNRDFVKMQEEYQIEFDLVSKYFMIFEIISLAGITTIGICGLMANFMQIHEIKKEIPRVREEVVGIEEVSLRPMKTTITLRT